MGNKFEKKINTFYEREKEIDKEEERLGYKRNRNFNALSQYLEGKFIKFEKEEWKVTFVDCCSGDVYIHYTNIKGKDENSSYITAIDLFEKEVEVCSQSS